MRRFVLLLLAIGFLEGCGEKVAREEVIATVGSQKITRTDLQRRLAQMPGYVRRQFEGEEGRQKLLEGVIDEEAFYLAALDMGLDSNPEVLRQIEAERRRILIRFYYQREIQPYTQMGDEDLYSYYEERLEDLYKKPLESVVRQVVVGSEEIGRRVRKMLLEGVRWDRVVREYCIDELTREKGGKIGPVPENSSLIPYIGSSYEMMVAIDTLTVGTISPVIQTSKGYHVFTVTERIPESYLPFEKMKDTIRRTFASDFAEKVRQERVALLREKYSVRVATGDLMKALPDEGEAAKVDDTAKKLFEMAQLASDPTVRLKYYREIVSQHPDDPHACEAQFMIAFVYSEELHNFDLAREAIDKVLEWEGGCEEDLISSARWMLENMGKEPPAFVTD